MVTRIAHLSDLHFGDRFNVATWTAVRNDVIDFMPHLLVVSGDLVDHPSPLHLLAAKGELYQLAKTAGARLVVVPGNHDLYAWGNRLMQRRADWFDRIFYCGDTTAAEQALEERFGEPPRFTETYRTQSVAAEKIRGWWQFGIGKTNDFTDLLPLASDKAKDSGLVTLPHASPVLLALFDSNAEDHAIGTATGSVAPAELLALNNSLKKEAARENATRYLARIAVIHHHVMPIAFTGGKFEGAEPFMVLHNAGSVLSVLAEHQFDLVLHGHQHKAQFARVDFDPRTPAGYSLSVASAGSAALASPYNERGNSYNRILIRENGGIEVENWFYGAEAAPNPRHVSKFQEPLSAVKRRAYARACERHELECDRWLRQIEIRDHGDLKVSHRVENLRLAKRDPTYLKRPHDLFCAPHGHLVESELCLDEESLKNNYSVELVAGPNSPERRCWVVLPDSPSDGRSASYTLQQGYANTLTMTRWEASERWRRAHGDLPPQGEWDHEWVGTRITHPVKQLTLRLKLPDGLRAVKPYLDCRRDQDFPHYAMDGATRDAIMPPVTLTSRDPEIRAYEDDRLSYDPLHRTWELTVLEPIVGYNYQLRWRLPPDTIEQTIRAKVVAAQRQLLATGDRTRHPGAWGVFDEHRPLIEGLLRDNRDPNEKRGLEVFVYDRSRLDLVPVFSYRSWTPGPLPEAFRIGLGDGIAGAAFQQRRVVPWSGLALHDPFIQPVPYPNVPGEESMDLKTMIAFPIYHSSMAKGWPPPWSVIGTVCFSSSSEASMIAGMCAIERSTDIEKLTFTAERYSQSMVQSILESLAAQ